MERRPITLGELIAARIEARGSCWVWTGTNTTDGYPILSSTTGNISIIPLLWRQEHGPVPEGHVLTCAHPRAGLEWCVNPAHYEPRPRGSVPTEKCQWGHDMTDPQNVLEYSGRRYCAECTKRRGREWRERNPGYHANYMRRRK